MSHPFLLWTLQRTGGTAFADQLMSFSQHPRAEHEPFNWSRQRAREFWPVVQRWMLTQDASDLARDLDAITHRGILIKHCFDLFPMPFNLALLDAAVRGGYRQVLLRREDEGGRLISKFVAESQGTWFTDYAREVFAEVRADRRQLRPVPVDQIVAQFHHARNMVEAMREAFAARKIDVAEVTFEALYRGETAERTRAIATVLRHLGFAEGDIDAQIVHLIKSTKGGGQNTGAVIDKVPNIEAVTQALEAAGCSMSGELTRRRLFGTLMAQLAAFAGERGWLFEHNIDGEWPGLNLRFASTSGLPFRIELADNSFDNVYFGIRSCDDVPNKSLDEALTMALGEATTSDTWPWCRHPSLADDILPINANWFAIDALTRDIADGSLAATIIVAADRFRGALVGAGYLTVSAAEWRRGQGLAMPEVQNASSLSSSAVLPMVTPTSLFDAAYLRSLGLTARTILDVGVGHGTKPLYEAFADRRFVLIDPRRGGKSLLRAWPRDYVFFNAALGRTPGTAQLSDGGAKSSLLERTVLTSDGPTSRYTVEITTLDAVLDQFEEPGLVGIKLDIEGYELEAIEGLVRHAGRVEWVLCEASICKRFIAGYAFGELVTAMQARGLVFFNVLGPIHRKPLFYDVLFLKEGHPLLQ